VKLRRTLLTAGVFALLAMIYVPTPRERGVHSAGYRFIFSGEDTSIAFFQLLVNVVFAALLGAILVTILVRIPKRALYAMARCIPIVVIVAVGVGVFVFTEAAANRAQRDEKNGQEALVLYPTELQWTLTKFRNAATNWRLALRFDQAARVVNRMKELQRHPGPQKGSGISFDDLIPQSRTPNPSTEQFQTAPEASASDFAKHAAKLREQSLLDLDPQVFAPTGSRPATEQFPWKKNIVTTVFWIGEPQSSENPKAHVKSAWDANWTANYGGVDTPDSSARRNYLPIAFIPRQNPFYCALPYNDVTDNRKFKPEASEVVPWFKRGYTGEGQSLCWHRWVAIRKGNRTCYAEWEDCGPFRTDHFQYVFGNEKPKPNLNHGAGLDVSPAVRDYLGLQPTDVTDWQFVDPDNVPAGPWRSYGEHNNFVIARRQAEQRLVQQGGNSGNSKK